MTFDLVRMGWPNTAAILALAVMPLVALATMTDVRPGSVQIEQIGPAAFCLTLAECPVTVASAVPETVLE
ncbi:MAG: hypothetical protein QOF09_2022 [Alphaproteobacteria bacterium]|jgi:hypothetical protein|nr:hypothetical protein [Alphaproteobacteria bacterium]